MMSNPIAAGRLRRYRRAQLALLVVAIAGCEAEAIELVQEIGAARGECTREGLRASDEECVRMMERYTAMGTELVHTYIGGLKALDRALDRSPPPQFDTTGLGYALSPEFRTGSAGAGASPRLTPSSAVYGYGARPGADRSGYSSGVRGERVGDARGARDLGDGRAGPSSRAWESAATTDHAIDGPRDVYSSGRVAERYGHGIPLGGARDSRGYRDDRDGRRLRGARSGRSYLDGYRGYSGSGRSRRFGGYAPFGIPDAWGYGSGYGGDDYGLFFRRGSGWGQSDRGGYVDPAWRYGGYAGSRYSGYRGPGYDRNPGPGYGGYAAPGYGGYGGPEYGGYAAPGYGGYEAPGYDGYGPGEYGRRGYDGYPSPADDWGYDQSHPPTEDYPAVEDEQAAERVDNGVPARPAPHQPGILLPPEERLRRPWLND